MSLLRFVMRRSRGVVFLSIAGAAVSGLGGVGLIAMVHRELARPSPSAGMLGVAFAGLCLLVAAGRVVAQVAIARLGQEAITEVALQLCRRVLELPLARFEAMDSSKLMAVLTEDVVIVAGALVGIPQIAINLPLIAVCLAYTGYLSPAILACGAVFATIAVLLYAALINPAIEHIQSARRGQDALVGHFRTMIDGFRELKQHAGRRQSFRDRALEPSARLVRDRSIASQLYFALAEGWGELAFFGFLGFVLFVLPQFQDVPRPSLVGVVLVVLYVMGPLDVILTWLPAVGRARASIERIEGLMPELTASEFGHAARPLALEESLVLEAVTHEYDKDAGESGFQLGPVDLLLRPGEIVLLAGGNGSGKTTLVKLLAGLYAPTSGRVLVDGVEISQNSIDSYRQLCSVLFADGYLFRDFYGLSRPGIETEAEDGLERLGLAEKLRATTEGFSTIDLSQGQRRRLALLTLRLEDRPVCIFDEWAANQDPQFRRAFYREILPEMREAGKAILVISHDEEYFDVADRVVHLRDGRVVERIEAGEFA